MGKVLQHVKASVKVRVGEAADKALAAAWAVTVIAGITASSIRRSRRGQDKEA